MPAKPAAELDMYADDFDEKEKANLTTASTSKDDSGPKESKNQGIKCLLFLFFLSCTSVLLCLV